MTKKKQRKAASDSSIKSTTGNAPAQKKNKPTKKSATTKKTASFASSAIAIISRDPLLEPQSKNLGALLGHGGHSQTPHHLDAVVREFYCAHASAEVQRAISGQFAGRCLLRVDVFDDCGVADATAPILYPGAIAERTEKLFKAHKIDAIYSIKARPTQAAHPEQRDGILLYARALVFGPAGTDARELQSALRATKTVLTETVPDIRVRAVAIPDVAREIGELLGLAPSIVRLIETQDGDANNVAMKACGPMSSTSDLLRFLTGQISVPTALFLRGTKGVPRDIVSRVVKLVHHAHRGRTDGGEVLPPSFDAWACLARCRQETNSSELPARTDIPVKSPPGVKKPKKARSISPGELHKHRKKNGLLKKIGKGPKRQP